MTTYYVDTVLGDDANAGTAEGAGNAWATIDHAMNTVAAGGDKVWVKASGNYNELVTIDTIATNTNPNVFAGYTSIPGDEGKVTIDGQSTRANCLVANITNLYYIFENFVFTGATSTGVSGTTGDGLQFYNCDSTNNGGDGFALDNNISFINCTATGNTGDGFDADSAPLFVGCISGGNGNNGFVATSDGKAYKCVVYGIGASYYGFNGPFEDVIGCTIDGENTATVGINLPDPSFTMCIDNIIYDCTTGVTCSASALPTAALFFNNLVNSNTTDYSNTWVNQGKNDVTTAPAFTDEANDDYTLDSASPAKNAGIQPGGIT